MKDSHASSHDAGTNSTSESAHEAPSNGASRSESSSVSRRDFLLKVSALGLAGVGASAFLSGCGGESDSGSGSASQSAGGNATANANLRCDDVSSLSAGERERRNAQIEALEYVTETPNPEKNCANCLFYQQPAQGKECGGCQLFPGPVHPNGYCKTWQAQRG